MNNRSYWRIGSTIYRLGNRFIFGGFIVVISRITFFVLKMMLLMRIVLNVLIRVVSMVFATGLRPVRNRMEWAGGWCCFVVVTDSNQLSPCDPATVHTFGGHGVGCIDLALELSHKYEACTARPRYVIMPHNFKNNVP